MVYQQHAQRYEHEVLGSAVRGQGMVMGMVMVTISRMLGAVLWVMRQHCYAVIT